MTIPEKLLAYNRANRAVAILCNHQRAVPKTHNKSMDNLREKIRLKREQVSDCQKDLKVCIFITSDIIKSSLKQNSPSGHKARISERRNRQREEEEAAGAVEGAAQQAGDPRDRQGREQNHRARNIEAQLLGSANFCGMVSEVHWNSIDLHQQFCCCCLISAFFFSSSVATCLKLVNIFFASFNFRCKKHGVPIEKIFNKTQRDKFRWAIEMVDEDYVF